MKPSIHGLFLPELEAFCKEQGQPVFRAKQIWDWLYVKRVSSSDEMQNLPAPFRARLAECFSFQCLEKLETKGDSGETQKLLFRLADNELIETVIIPAPRRQTNTVCVSSQVGCRVGCAFCASGQKGVIRNLTAGEIVGEVLEVARLLGGRPDNVVFMGIGEPFDNYDEVLRAIRIMNHPDGLCIGARRITISTCGVVSGIQRLADEGIQVELSVSLHAPDDEIRSRVMPVNETWPLDELLDACRAYTDKTNRIITFEYTLIEGVNDSEAEALGVAAIAKPLKAKINIIPYNAVSEFGHKPPSLQAIQRFCRTLEKRGLRVMLRQTAGQEIDAACGQLRLDRSMRQV